MNKSEPCEYVWVKGDLVGGLVYGTEVQIFGNIYSNWSPRSKEYYLGRVRSVLGKKEPKTPKTDFWDDKKYHCTSS